MFSFFFIFATIREYYREFATAVAICPVELGSMLVYVAVGAAGLQLAVN